MSKLAVIQQYQYSPMAGGILGKLVKGAGKLFGGIFGKKKLTQVVAGALPAAKKIASQVGPAVLTGAGFYAGEQLLAGSGGSGASGAWGPRRRAKGITARELRGYRKVANLLHKEGMVSRRARGRK